MNRVSKKRIVQAYQNVCLSPDGKVFLDNLNKVFPWMRQGVKPVAPIDTNTVMVMQGECNVLKHIYSVLCMDPNEERQDVARNRVNLEMNKE